MDDIKKESATYDAPETDQLMTQELSERDDYGQAGNGQMGEEFHDYLEDSRTFGGDQTPSRHQQELWNRFREWQKNQFQKKREVGKEPQEGGHPIKDDEALSEGYWQRPLPYVGFDGSRTFMLAMPSQKQGALSSADIEKVASDWVKNLRLRLPEHLVPEWDKLVEKYPNLSGTPLLDKIFADASNLLRPAIWNATGAVVEEEVERVAPEVAKDLHLLPNPDSRLNKTAIDQYSDHHVDVTFEFMIDEIKITCTWDREDLPKGLDEAQTLSRVVQFLDKKLPHAFQHLEHATVNDIDLRNRTLSLLIPTGHK